MRNGLDVIVKNHLLRAIVISLLLFPVSFPLWAQNAASIPDFYQVGDYVLEMDGKLISGVEFYLAEQKPALLILTPELPVAVVLLPGDQSVQTVPGAQVTKKPEGRIDLSLDSATDQGKLEILASWIRFSVNGHTLTLKQKPWLLGVQDVPSMEENNPEYVWRSNGYTPDPEIIQALAKQPTEVEVRVFFGSWCPHCKHRVPLMMKVDEALSASHIKIDYYGLPRGWAQHPVAGPLKITSVPMAIVTVDGKEVGRIKDNKWDTPEVALKEILLQ
jgi:thiol-disulfide isomerase/thioredoxin